MEMIGNKKAYIDSSFDNEHGDEKKIVDESNFEGMQRFVQNRAKQVQIDSSKILADYLAEQKVHLRSVEVQTMQEIKEEIKEIEPVKIVQSDSSIKLMKCKDEISKLTGVIKTKSATITELEISLSEMELKLSAIHQIIQSKDKSIWMLKEDCKNKDKRIKALESDLNSLEMKVNILKREYEMIQDKHEARIKDLNSENLKSK